MDTLLSIPTIMVCTAVTTTVVALALTYVLFFADNREAATGWWCAGMWVATMGTLVLALREVGPAWLAIGGGNALIMLAYGLVAAGFSAFVGRRPSLMVVVLGTAVWLGFYIGSPHFRTEINDRMMLISLMHGLYGVLVVRDAWTGWKQEALPSFVATLMFFSTNSLIYFMRMPLTILYPVTDERGVIRSTWIGLTALESFALTIFSSFVFMSLIKERAERRYRLAAEIDALTGAASRRHFVEAARAALIRQPRSAVLAVVDLDFFKAINDTYGHMAGDRVLQVFARHVALELQPGMVFGRLGGEEFGLCLPDCEPEAAAAFLERLRLGIEALEIRFNGNVLRVTASIGATTTRDTGHDFDNMMAAADVALYLAKEEGRNRSRMFSPAMRLERILDADGRESRVGLASHRISRLSVRSRPGQR